MYEKNKNVKMSIQKAIRMKKIESNFDFVFVGLAFLNTTSDTTCRLRLRLLFLTFFNNLMCC